MSTKIIKKVIGFVIALSLVLTLFSCGPGSKAAKEVSIEYWTTSTQSDRMATIQVLIDSFQALNPHIKITLVPVDENDMATQVQTASAAGNLPAMVDVGAELAVAFGVEGLLDTKAATEFINSLGKEKFYAGTLRLVETNQKNTYYAVPYYGWVQGIWYRSDWFEKAGLNPPATWEDIEKAAKYFYKPKENQYGILVGTQADTYAEQCFTQIAMSNGAQLFDKDGNLTFNSAAMKQAVQYYAKIAQYNPPGPQTWRARDYYLQGKMAMFFYSTYIMDDLALQEVAASSLTGEHFANLKGTQFDPNLVEHTGMAPIITEKEPAGYGVVEALVLFKQKDPAVVEATNAFLKYLYTQNAYITFLHMAPGGMNPVLKEIATNPRFLNDPKGIFKHYGKEKMAEIIQGLNDIETFSIVDGRRIGAASVIFSKMIIPQMIYKITQEGMDIDKAMNWAEGEMKKVMAQ